jgi:hypothetical protein
MPDLAVETGTTSRGMLARPVAVDPIFVRQASPDLLVWRLIPGRNIS